MKAPYQFQVPMTKEKYTELSKNLASTATVNGNAGSITTHDVSLNWTYDGVEKVTVDVTATHSLAADIASNEQVQTRIERLLNQS